jgi:cytochrome oxidase Cu insertion factor (SCO1/SenC/PrrC family)
MKAKVRNNAVLASLILTFTIPLLLAGLLFWYGLPLNGKTTNYGQLIQPTISLSQLAPTDTSDNPLPNKDILGKWVLLTLSPSVCDKACEKSLYEIRQICKATGKEQTRLRQVVLSLKGHKVDTHLENLLNKEYPLTKQWVIDSAKFRELTGISENQPLNATQGAIYFIDPMGNTMMRYSPTANPSGIFKDLSKLLRVSQIG